MTTPTFFVRGVALAAALALSACAQAPSRPATPAADALARAQVPTQLPGSGISQAATPLAWRDWLRDPQLLAWVDTALQHNRDLRVAMLTVQRAQAQLGLADAARLPNVGVGLGASRAPNSKGTEATTWTGGVQLAAWEIDLFGRLSSLSDAARAQVLASEAGRRAAELSLVAAVVQAGLAVQADDELLALAKQAVDSREQSVKLARLRESVGAASQLDLQGQLSLLAQAQATLAQAQRQHAQDRNALALLLGQPAGDSRPTARLADGSWLADVPAGLSAQVLLRRPDVIAAEQALLAAQANVAAARAAFWPTITLTGQAGQASPQLSGLFQGGNFVYTVASSLALTVFDGGRRQANEDVARANQQVAQAQYERAIQSAFRDTADALAGLSTWREQATAQRALLAASRETQRLTDLRAANGAASVLEQLDAQRAVWAAEQAVVQVRLAELNNRVALYKALGG